MRKILPNISLEKHLQSIHAKTKFADHFREVLYGGNDGIVTSFAVVAGFSGANLMGETVISLSFMTVLLFGIANLFADGVSMGLGSLLGVLAEREIYEKEKEKERVEIINTPQMEKKWTLEILYERGFHKKDAQTMLHIFEKNKDYWVEWMMHHEVAMANPKTISPIYSGMVTTLSFIFFGIVPLIPYFFLKEDVLLAFTWSVMFVILSLISLGTLKWYIAGNRLWRSIAEVVLIGGLASVVAFVIGILLG